MIDSSRSFGRRRVPGWPALVCMLITVWCGSGAPTLAVPAAKAGQQPADSIGVSASSESTEPESTESESKEAAEVRSAFERYRRALIEGDAELASSLVDSATFAYLEELKQLALVAEPEALSARSFVDRLLVVTLRHTLAADQIRTLTLTQLISLAIDGQWLSAATLEQLRMGAITVQGDEAWGEALTAAGDSLQSEGLEELRYEFRRERESPGAQGAWKFRFAGLVESLGVLVGQFTAQLGTQDEALIFMLVENLSGKPVAPGVWEARIDPGTQTPP